MREQVGPPQQQQEERPRQQQVLQPRPLQLRLGEVVVAAEADPPEGAAALFQATFRSSTHVCSSLPRSYLNAGIRV